jgi:hypothetical protein
VLDHALEASLGLTGQISQRLSSDLQQVFRAKNGGLDFSDTIPATSQLIPAMCILGEGKLPDRSAHLSGQLLSQLIVLGSKNGESALDNVLPLLQA